MDQDTERFLSELQARWRGANSLQYRSIALLSHANEFKVHVAISVILRRPNLGRLRFDTDDVPEAARVRVGDGRVLRDRQQGEVGRTGLTQTLAYRDRLTDGLPHPLDEVAYFPDQFFAPLPFTPSPYWGNGAEALKVEVRTLPSADAIRVATETLEGDRKRTAQITASWPKTVLRLTFKKGAVYDTLYFGPADYAPLALIRVGDHAGRIQELLREVFTEFALGTLSGLVNPFVWTANDERGIVTPGRN